MLRFSLIICTYNRASYLKETIESILDNFKDKYNYELLIIDNNSKDHTTKVVEQFIHNPVVRYFLETNQGLSYARNRGMMEAKNDVFVFLDDDIDIEKNYLSLMEQLYSDPAVNIVGGKVLPYKAAIPDWLPQKFFFIASIFDIGNEPQFVDKLMGANYSMRREVAEKTGLYNTDLGRKGSSLMAGEEVDYLRRAQNLGYKVLYHPRLIVYHKIENKLNKNYIYDNMYKNGKTEALLDAKNKVRLFLRSIKSLLRILIYYLFGFYAPNHKQRVYFKMNQLQGLGYLQGFMKHT